MILSWLRQGEMESVQYFQEQERKGSTKSPEVNPAANVKFGICQAYEMLSGQSLRYITKTRMRRAR